MKHLIFAILLLGSCTNGKDYQAELDHLQKQSIEMGRLQEKNRWLKFVSARTGQVQFELSKKPQGCQNLADAASVWAQPLPDSLTR